MMIGEIIEDRTVRKAQESVKAHPTDSSLGEDKTPEGEREIPIEQVKTHDIILVKPGESIP